MTDKTNPEKAAKELTILLMYLTRFNEQSRFESDLDMAWKGFDFDIINELDKEGYIRQGSHRSKSVVITDEGMKLSRELLTKYNISDWK
jgi:Mn-dependent DtxR family transcriptional regulator